MRTYLLKDCFGVYKTNQINKWPDATLALMASETYIGNDNDAHMQIKAQACFRIMQTFQEHIPSNKISPNILMDACCKANAAMQELHKRLRIHKDEIDYMNRDFFGCFPCIVSLNTQVFHYLFLPPCGIMQIRNGGIIWESEDELSSFMEGENLIKLRKEMRNIFSGYGVLNGEPGVLEHVRVGTQTFSAKDILIVFSPGMRQCLKQEEMVQAIASEDMESVQNQIKTAEISDVFEWNVGIIYP